MPRPRKWRKVCSLPESSQFGPLDARAERDSPVAMSVDEYEAISLIDLENLTQEECALQMRVARTTVQRIYSDARRKVAESLVHGRILKIEGGDYQICDGSEEACRRGNCHRRRHGRGL